MNQRFKDLRERYKRVRLPQPLLFYEPKPTPILDDHGNVVSHVHPSASCLTLADSDAIRTKLACNENGLSCDPSNVTGFQALLDLMNQGRNLQGFCYQTIGFDDLSVMNVLTKHLPANE